MYVCDFRFTKRQLDQTFSIPFSFILQISAILCGGKRAKMENISSDLSAQEKELLMPKKKSREERKHERRQKRERDREKREYERKRRRERHGRHRKAGLVQEHLIPVSPPLRFILSSFIISFFLPETDGEGQE